MISNAIKSKAEVSTGNLREIFNESCRDVDGATSVTFKSLESSMFKRRKIRQPKLPSSVQEFDALLQKTQYFTIHLQTVFHMDHTAIIFGSIRMVRFLKLMGLALLPEEEILLVFLSLEIPSLGLLNSEKEMVKRFRIYCTKTWINEHRNLSVFYYEMLQTMGQSHTIKH